MNKSGVERNRFAVAVEIGNHAVVAVTSKIYDAYLLAKDLVGNKLFCVVSEGLSAFGGVDRIEAKADGCFVR